MESAICMEMLYPGESAVEKVRATAERGFSLLEFWGRRGKNIDEFKSVCAAHNVTVEKSSVHRTGSPNSADTHTAVLSDFRNALSVAEVLGCQRLIVLSNDLGELGEVVSPLADIQSDVTLQNFFRLLTETGRMVPPGTTMVIEPLNTRVNHSGSYLKDMRTVAAIGEGVRWKLIR